MSCCSPVLPPTDTLSSLTLPSLIALLLTRWHCQRDHVCHSLAALTATTCPSNLQLVQQQIVYVRHSTPHTTHCRPNSSRSPPRNGICDGMMRFRTPHILTVDAEDSRLRAASDCAHRHQAAERQEGLRFAGARGRHYRCSASSIKRNPP